MARNLCQWPEIGPLLCPSTTSGSPWAALGQGGRALPDPTDRGAAWREKTAVRRAVTEVTEVSRQASCWHGGNQGGGGGRRRPMSEVVGDVHGRSWPQEVPGHVSTQRGGDSNPFQASAPHPPLPATTTGHPAQVSRPRPDCFQGRCCRAGTGRASRGWQEERGVVAYCLLLFSNVFSFFFCNVSMFSTT